MKPDEIQRKMNKIDRELLVLLQERMGLALRSTKFKADAPEAPEQETDMLARAERLNLDLIESAFTRQLLKTIIEESKRLQDEYRPLVAFQGEHGAYGEVASRQLVPAGAYIPCLEFIDVFRGVEEGHFDLGVVPVENSLEGAVTQVNDLLTTTDLKVIGEVKVAGTDTVFWPPKPRIIAKSGQVYSHPQALAQCRNFLMRNNLEPHPYYDTAGAAKMLARENPSAAAAIASSLCAELYDLEIIKEGIEDGPVQLRPAFCFWPANRIPTTAIKHPIIFAAPHEGRASFRGLQLFADADINLTRIASMPLRSDPGNYSFFLDFEGYEQDKQVGAVLKAVDKLTIWLKLLGSYPAHVNGK